MLVIFRFPTIIWAENVYLFGDFNQWDSSSLPMAYASGDLYWEAKLELERGKSYQFCYLVNGAAQCNDPNADCYAHDPYGRYVSVVET